jgi:hypothetical protein
MEHKAHGVLAKDRFVKVCGSVVPGIVPLYELPLILTYLKTGFIQINGGLQKKMPLFTTSLSVEVT